MAKVVIIKFGDKAGMLVLPASHKVDFKKIMKLAGTKNVRLATEKEFKALFPDCEIGAMPPFGSLYNIPVSVDKALTKNERIIFNAGSHKDTVKMNLRDFDRLEKPALADFSVHM